MMKGTVESSFRNKLFSIRWIDIFSFYHFHIVSIKRFQFPKASNEEFLVIDVSKLEFNLLLFSAEMKNKFSLYCRQQLQLIWI